MVQDEGQQLPPWAIGPRGSSNGQGWCSEHLNQQKRIYPRNEVRKGWATQVTVDEGNGACLPVPCVSPKAAMLRCCFHLMCVLFSTPY